MCPRVTLTPRVLVMMALVCGLLHASAWESGPGFRSRAVAPSASARVGFTSLPPSQTGVLFTNLLDHERGLTNQIYQNGSGVALGDVDGDGLCDIYLGNVDGPNVLYRNLGNWRFEDITARAGVACPKIDTAGVLFMDVDGDRDLDLLVNGIGSGTLVFLNDGRGQFTDATGTAGTAAKTGSTSFAAADVDGDGDLDLYVTNYRTVTLRDEPFTRFTVKVVNGKHFVSAVNGRSTDEPDLVGRFAVDQRGSIVEHGEADVLYRNDGGGRFTAMSFTNGMFLDETGQRSEMLYEFGLSVLMRDFNGDGWPDIYVCNDFDEPDRFWINQGNGVFRAAPLLALRQTSLFSMGVDVADIDRDGHDDFFVVDMLSREHARRSVQLGDRRPVNSMPGDFLNRPQYMRNTLFWNRGDGTYAEIAAFAGLEASEWSWTPAFLDVDLDGYEDVLVTNGHERDAQNLDVSRRIEAHKKERRMSVVEQLRLRKAYPRLENPACAFRNRGDLRFDDVSDEWGFNAMGAKQGMAMADLDNDGDLDVVLNALNSPAVLYRNDAGVPRVQVRLRGKAPNTHGVGAKVRVLGGPVPQSQEMICGGRFASGDDFVRTFAAGSVTNQLTIEVTWRDGTRSVVTNALANRIYEIDQAGAQAVPKQERAPKPEPLFRDASELLAHAHHEEDFNDFERQPLLVRKLSQSGPGVSWFDVDGDGHDDLIFSSGRGGTLTIRRNNGRGGFETWTQSQFAAATHDQTSVLGVARKNGRQLIVGSSNYESGDVAAGAQIVDPASGKTVASLPGQPSSTGPLALADINGDGELDLFIGGRVLPGRYPEAASSQLFFGTNGAFALDGENTKKLEKIGLVTSAVFSDLDADGAPELLLACEWGPIRIFQFRGGKLETWNAPLRGEAQASLDQLTGAWHSVATGDFNGDGRLDIVAGNMGENTIWQRSAPEPVRIYYGDFDDNGVFDVLEAAPDRFLRKVVPLRDANAVARWLPYLAGRFTGFTDYGRAGIDDLFLDRSRVREQSIVTTRSLVLLSRGTHFEIRALPVEAQISPVFGMAVADFNGDGHEDLVLAQNFFAVEPMTARHDAGRSLLLAGRGDGTFRAAAAPESGIAVYGEGRGVAVSDFDHDGRVDVCIGQNGAATKLYRNATGKPGLRVRLQDPAENPGAIGATVRATYADGSAGPLREIRAGGGWLSQDSSTPVIARRADIQSIAVRWPGGKLTEAKVPAGAAEILLNSAGNLHVLR